MVEQLHRMFKLGTIGAAAAHYDEIERTGEKVPGDFAFVRQLSLNYDDRKQLPEVLLVTFTFERKE